MTKTYDMTKGPIGRQLFAVAVPAFLSALLQQLYFIADTLIISNFLGDDALAAVTNCEQMAYLTTAFIFGIGMGMSVVIAQAFGARKFEWMRKAEGTGIALALLTSVLMIGFGMLVSRPVLVLMNTPENVLDLSVTYLTIYLSGSGGIFIFNACSGIRQAAGDTKTPLYFLIFSTVLNVGLDLLLIGPGQMGVAGAAFATITAEYLSGFGMLFYLFRLKDEQRLGGKEIRFNAQAVREIFRMGFPGALESSATSFANAMIQGFVNTFGSSVMAALGAFAAIDGFAFLPISAFCMALGTFTGQNVGALQEKRTRKGVRFAMVWLLIGCLLIGMFIMFFCRDLMRLFTSSEQTIEYAIIKARYTCFFYPLLGITHCMASVFRGAGKPVIPMIAYLVGWGVLRVVILSVLMPLYHDFDILCWIYPLTWLISTLFLLACYRWTSWFPKKEPTLPAEFQNAA